MLNTHKKDGKKVLPVLKKKPWVCLWGVILYCTVEIFVSCLYHSNLKTFKFFEICVGITNAFKYVRPRGGLVEWYYQHKLFEKKSFYIWMRHDLWSLWYPGTVNTWFVNQPTLLLFSYNRNGRIFQLVFHLSTPRWAERQLSEDQGTRKRFNQGTNSKNRKCHL